MRKLLATLLVGTCLLPGLTDRVAAQATLHPSASVARLALSDAHIHRERVGTSPSDQSADLLKLPDSAFSPATVNTTFSGVVDTTLADQEPFRQNHSAPYETWGRQTGYYQRADWQPPGYTAADTVTFRYMGSIFPDATSANTAWQDGISYTQSQLGAARSSCTETDAPCADLSFQATDSGVAVVIEYSALLVGSCLLEASVEATRTAAGAETGQIHTTLGHIETAAVQAATGACVAGQPQPTSTVTPPSVAFSILAVRAEAAKSRPDWNLVHPPLTVVQQGKPVRLSVYYHVSNAPAGYSYSETLTIKRGGTSIVHQTFPDSLGSNPVDTYRNSWEFTPPSSGRYIVTIGVTMGGQTQALATSLTVQKAAPPAPQRASFSLDQVGLLNVQGHAQSTFAGGSQFYVYLRYTVRNLKTKAPLYVAITFELSGTGKALYPPNQYQLTAVNGHQSYRTRFFVPARPGAVLRVVVGVTIGHTTVKKSTTLSISRDLQSESG